MTKPEQPKQPAKKAYSAPKLVVHGKVRKLTQAGSKGQPEGGSGKSNKKL